MSDDEGRARSACWGWRGSDPARCGGCGWPKSHHHDNTRQIEALAASGGADRPDPALAELRELSDAATAGEWWVSVDLNDDPYDDDPSAIGIGTGSAEDPIILAMTPGPASFDNGSDPDAWDDDAAFIVAAVNYVRSRLAPSTDPAPEPGEAT